MTRTALARAAGWHLLVVFPPLALAALPAALGVDRLEAARDAALAQRANLPALRADVERLRQEHEAARRALDAMQVETDTRGLERWFARYERPWTRPPDMNDFIVFHEGRVEELADASLVRHASQLGLTTPARDGLHRAQREFWLAEALVDAAEIAGAGPLEGELVFETRLREGQVWQQGTMRLRCHASRVNRLVAALVRHPLAMTVDALRLEKPSPPLPQSIVGRVGTPQQLDEPQVLLDVTVGVPLLHPETP